MTIKENLVEAMKQCNALSYVAVGGGLTNSSFKLLHSDRTVTFVTITDVAQTQRELHDEVCVSKLLNSVGIKTPRILKLGSFFIEKELMTGVNLDEFFLSSPSESDTVRVISGLGESLRKLHSFEFKHFGKINFEISDGSSESWLSYLRNRLRKIELRISQLDQAVRFGRFGNHDLQEALESTLRLFEEAKPYLSQIAHPRLIHGDARLANFMAKTDQGVWKFDAIIDLDCCIAGDPDLDIVQIENWLQFTEYGDRIIKLKNTLSAGDRSLFRNDRGKKYRWRFYHCLRSLEYLLEVSEISIREPELAKGDKIIGYVSKHSELIHKLLHNERLNYQFIQ